jgi:hypothetical protein
MSITHSEISEDLGDDNSTSRLPPKNVRERKRGNNLDLPIGVSDEESLLNLINEKNKIMKFLAELNYLVPKEIQTDPVKINKIGEKEFADASTQRPDHNDLVSEVVDTLEPRAVAQTQLNLLIEVLQKLKSQGMLTHFNLSEEDLELIKSEMRKIFLEKKEQQDLPSYFASHRFLYTGGSSFKASGALNLGMKDPTLHYVEDNSQNLSSQAPRPKSKLSPGMIVKFWKKTRKYKH